MLAHHGPHGDGFGRSEGAFPPKYLSLEQIQLLPRKHSTTSSKRASRSHKLRILTSPVAPAYCPSTTVAPTLRPKRTKSIRPKLEPPPSPAMSGYSYSSSDQGNYGYQTPYQTGVPQYTQSQINAYYAQYQCYPAQPYQIVPDYYVQPAIQQPEYQQPVGAYDTASWHTQGDIPTSQGPTRSTSRTKTWSCDIHGCTSSANFTRLADLQRHQSTVHGMGTPEFPCSVPRCNRVGDKGFTRRDHLVEHLRNFHHIDIPKRRPGERSAFPFGWPEGGGGASGSAHNINNINYNIYNIH
ncbi:hypothetical protein PTNB73_03519 [Pyrenophora teres f. teres]|nr:hypothetical protein HRS9139_02848 [Pyrenophora teres f. teres]KAE8844430.1 hypothetical protein PTNB85_02695 [Pyrenophora teres f. teres]KAE8847373.1 hypothetical protein HRS9122_04280 [Pyrenophora teres f. teres]KAE8866423.1 hypothetical protein PTNB29_03570 [Pyrenophora teres f. teres]KAE8872060.1 hypothetical protein PTNB73_03519 [Pyrenophora teres f. teres]